MSTTLSRPSGVAVQDIPTIVVPERSQPPQPVMQRNLAVDAYRGLVMMLMMGEVLSFTRVYHALPGNWFWAILSFNQSHVEWAGCSLHDMIQPSFSFLVGVALPYSIASRLRKGRDVRKAFRPCVMAFTYSRRPGRLLAINRQATNLLHIRGHAFANRLRISVSVSARIPSCEVAMVGFRLDPRRLLAGLGSVSSSRTELRLSGSRRSERTGSTISPDLLRTGIRTAISGMPLTSGFSTCFLERDHSSTTMVVI